MFLSLLQQECKMWLKSFVFYAYVIILFLFYISTMGDETVLKKPQPGRSYYEMTYSDDENVIMNKSISNLIEECKKGYFITYPFGFYKEVILSEEEKLQIESCVSELTRMTKQEWQQETDNYVPSDLTYESFLKIMKKVTKVIGEGSDYSEKNLKEHGVEGVVSKTYEQSLSEYEDVIEKDHVTGAYARLFSDYIGIILGILPAFFGIARVMKEKRNKVVDVVYSKKAGSIVIVLSRYVGMEIMMFLPVLLVSFFSLTQAVYIADAAGASPDYFVYVKYCTGWLLPIILFVSAISYLIAELTENMIGILVNVFLWVIAIFTNQSIRLIGAGWNLIPRFNSLGEYQLFQKMLPQLIQNRILYTVMSVTLIGILIVLYEIKRKGGYWIRGKVSKNLSSKHSA